MRWLPVLALFVAVLPAGCTLFIAGTVSPCDDDNNCRDGESCVSGFCQGGGGEGGGEGEKAGEGEGDVGGEGEDPGEGEGEVVAEGEGEVVAEGEGEIVIIGEGEGEPAEGEGEPAEGEGEGEVIIGGEGEGEPAEVFFEFCGDVPPPAWADPAFGFRLPLSFCDLFAPNTDVVDLPILVKLTSADVDFARFQRQGKDVRFFDQRAAGAPILLSHERVTFTASSATFWVKLPRFNPSTERDHIWMYFGANDATDTSDGAATFSAYNASFHMESANGVEAKSGRATDIIPAGNPAKVSAGAALVDNGVDLNGNNKFMVLDDDGDLTGNSNFGINTQTGSISVVVGKRPNGNPMGDGMVVFLADGQGDCGAAATCSFGFDQRSLHLTIGQTTGDERGAIGVSMPTNPARPAAAAFVVAAGGVLERDALSHVLVSWNANNVKIFVNGQFVIEQSVAIVPFQSRFIDIGTSQQLANVFTGSVDELRLSNSPRNAAFVRAEAKSTLDQLVTIGPTEAR
jgi:hypothetical protein